MLTAAVAANPFDETAQLALADEITEATGDHPAARAAAKRVALESRVAAFVAHVDAVVARYWREQNFTFSPPPTHRADYISDKWVRVVVIEHDAPGDAGRVKSVYCFVCLKDSATKALGAVRSGDIHKPDGFKRAARVARGSVLVEDFGKCAGPHGVSYLR